MRCVWLGADSMITALGFSSEQVISSIEEYRIGCREINDERLWSKPLVAGRINERQVPDIEGYTLLERMLIAVTDDVVKRSEIDTAAPDSCLIVSSTKGNIELLSGAGITEERIFLSDMAQRVAVRCGFKNMPLVISNACISGVSAIIVAARLIDEGIYRNVVVVGGDTMTRFVVTGFQGFKSVSGQVCRPYDEARDGLTLGEACAAVLLTSEIERAEKPYIEVAGGAISNDANHISAPSRTGDGLCFAIEGAMKEAEVFADEVGFVNGHGTGTPYNDEMESKAFALAGLDGVPVNGFKPYFGHTLGASGVVESIVSAHALRKGVVYGTPGFEKMGTPYRVDVSPQHRQTTKDVCVKTASGFGGCNAAIVLRKTEGESAKVAPKGSKPTIYETGSVHIVPDGRPFGEMIRERFKALESPNMKFFKMDALCKLGYVAAEELLRNADIANKYMPEEIGIVLANVSSSLDTDIRHCLQIEQNGEDVSPAVFVYTLPNVVAGEISIRHKIQGENTFFIQTTPSIDFLESYARMILKRGYLKAVIYGWCELLGEEFDAKLILLETK